MKIGNKKEKKRKIYVKKTLEKSRKYDKINVILESVSLPEYGTGNFFFSPRSGRSPCTLCAKSIQWKQSG